MQLLKLCGACGEVDLAVQVCERYCDKPWALVKSPVAAAMWRPRQGQGGGGVQRYCDKAIEWHEEAGRGRGLGDGGRQCAHPPLVVIGRAGLQGLCRDEEGLAADATTFNSLIWGCGRVGQEQRALKVCDEMVKFGLGPAGHPWSSSDLHATAGAPDEGMRVLAR